MNACVSPSSYPMLFREKTRIIHVGFWTKTTLNRRWGGVLLFLFRGDGSLAQKWQNKWNFLIRFVLGCRLEYFTAPIFFSFFQPLLKHHMSATIPLHQAVCTSSGIRFPNMRTTVIYSVTPFTIIPLVITMEDGRTSVCQQQATLSQAFTREPNMRFVLLHSLW